MLKHLAFLGVKTLISPRQHANCIQPHNECWIQVTQLGLGLQWPLLPERANTCSHPSFLTSCPFAPPCSHRCNHLPWSYSSQTHSVTHYSILHPIWIHYILCPSQWCITVHFCQSRSFYFILFLFFCLVWKLTLQLSPGFCCVSLCHLGVGHFWPFSGLLISQWKLLWMSNCGNRTWPFE